MIKVVSFDIGGTLIFSKEKDNYTLKQLTEIVGLPYSEVRKAYKDIFQKKKGTLEELETLFCQKLGIEVTDSIDNFFTQKFSTPSSKIEWNLDLIEGISKLKEKGYRIILFSNSCCLMPNHLSQEVLDKVDFVFYSFDMGYTKSEEESYRYIEQKLECSGSEILHIGDHLSSDYLKPKEYGWNALLYGKPKETEISYVTSMKKILEKV